MEPFVSVFESTNKMVKMATKIVNARTSSVKMVKMDTTMFNTISRSKKRARAWSIKMVKMHTNLDDARTTKWSVGDHPTTVCAPLESCSA